MRQPYPLEPNARISRPMRSGAHPLLSLLKALYGADQRSVERGIVRTLFGGKTKVRLAAPAAEAFLRIDAAWKLRPADPELNSYFSPIYGYFWRAIAKTNRLSPHSFGIAGGSQSRQGSVLAMEQTPPASVAEDLPLRHRLTL